MFKKTICKVTKRGLCSAFFVQNRMKEANHVIRAQHVRSVMSMIKLTCSNCSSFRDIESGVPVQIGEVVIE